VALSEARIAIAADSVTARLQSARLVYGGLREKELAEEAFQRALRFNPNDPDTNPNYAWLSCAKQREEEAISYFPDGGPASPLRHAAEVLCDGGGVRDAQEQRTRRHDYLDARCGWIRITIRR